MLDLPENELFSAYIDGELSADEKVEVERILTGNPEARQLVDELRSLSSSLQALPSHQLDQDFASRVLQQAEREMLSEPATPLPKFHQVDEPQPGPASWARRFLQPRNFVWSAAAIVVAVFLMLNEPGSNDGGGSQLAEGSGNAVIQSLDIVPTVDAIVDPPTAMAANVSDPGDKDADPLPVTPEPVEPSPAPTMVAEKDPATPERTAAAPHKHEANPLLVLECLLAEGRIGSEALAEVLRDAKVAVDEPIAEQNGAVELELTTNQLRQVIAHLQSDRQHFAEFSFKSTSTTAAPRIPSPLGPGDAHAHEAGDADKPGEPKAPDAAAPVQPPKSIPVQDDSTYRVRFLLKPGKDAPKPEVDSKK